MIVTGSARAAVVRRARGTRTGPGHFVSGGLRPKSRRAPLRSKE